MFKLSWCNSLEMPMSRGWNTLSGSRAVGKRWKTSRRSVTVPWRSSHQLASRPFQFIFFCATQKLCNVLSIEDEQRTVRIRFILFDMRDGAGHHSNKGCLLSVCLGQKVYINETRTGTAERNKAMGAVIGFKGKKETQPDASQRMKENAERAEEDVVIPPPLESEDMSLQWLKSLKWQQCTCC